MLPDCNSEYVALAEESSFFAITYSFVTDVYFGVTNIFVPTNATSAMNTADRIIIVFFAHKALNNSIRSMVTSSS